ncbi:hypothetical protein GO013_04110 [Pseudodesulfovibrio sp. JC047]|uniref:hypothetical protein n=1 Tax=Pseudodesulfovibrio sp. JC047 TaxID=2683199 RepID=UPI0013D5E227|nr:hypothetical protein [Pseudodesulfovibrio sp. JC047]NDV18604.1 hypothetical protein [Pseudodesulfovibrio sp. JC047]
MARIKYIKIENIKGIKKQNFPFELIPNKPTIFVASNGFGKSSFATAFNAMNRNRIKLEENEQHELNEANQPIIKVGYSENNRDVQELSATSGSNEIFKEFDVQVIRNPIQAKHTKKNMGRFTAVSSYMCVPPIILIDKIPKKQKSPYSFTNCRRWFGNNGKVLPNISSDLNDSNLVSQISRKIDLSKLIQVKPTKAIQALQSEINQLKGTKGTIIGAISQDQIDPLRSVKRLKRLALILERFGSSYDTKAEYYLSAIQIVQTFKSNVKAFKAYCNYCTYCFDEARLKESFEVLKPTWKKIKPTKIKDQLILDFPEAQHISNGERDILCFTAMLIKAGSRLNGEKCILIIDEIFDYLDDANLVSAQYYLTKMIKKFKENKRQLYPIILTHLNPCYFKNFCFKDQKVHYLEKKDKRHDRKVHDLIVKRSDPSVKDHLGRHYLHFHSADVDLTQQFATLGLDSSICTSQTFKQHIFNELKNYLSNQNYDPVSVCCAIRVKIEELVYDHLDPAYQPNFLDTNKTANKLIFAEENGLNIPSPFFLLGIIYNEAMHFPPTQDNFTPLFSKLNNQTIRHMIEEVIDWQFQQGIASKT